MTTSRIYAYRWPARLVSHKPFAAESYSITPSCIWQVFFRKKNEFSFLFSPFCQSAHFLCKMHNPQAFLPVENFPCPAFAEVVWTVLLLLYIYNKRQGRSSTVLALSGKACRLCQLSPKGELDANVVSKRRGRGCFPAARPFPKETSAADAGRLYDPTREKVNRENPQIFPIDKFKIILPLKMRRAARRAVQIISSSAVPPAHPGA